MLRQSLIFFDTKKNKSRESFLAKTTGLLPTVQISPKKKKKPVEGGEVGERRMEINNGTWARDEAMEAHRGQRGLATLSSFPTFSLTVSATITQKSSKIIILEPFRQTY